MNPNKFPIMVTLVIISIIIASSIAYYFIKQNDSSTSNDELCQDFGMFDPLSKGVLSIKIALPTNYKLSENFVSIYLLDANYFFTKSGTLDYLIHNEEGMTAITSRLIENEVIPQAVLIGIGYSEPQRDSLTGRVGSDAFYNFFKDKLIPEIESRCKVSTSPKDRILFGYSGSASFSTYALMRDALDNVHTFDKYISVSGVYYETEHKRLQNITDLNEPEVFSGRDFYFGVGTEDDRFLEGNRIFSDILMNNEYQNFNTKYEEYSGIGHYDIAEVAYETALRWIYSL